MPTLGHLPLVARRLLMIVQMRNPSAPVPISVCDSLGAAGLEISYCDRAPQLGLDLRSQALPLVAGRLLGALARLSQTRPPPAVLRHIQVSLTVLLSDMAASLHACLPAGC